MQAKALSSRMNMNRPIPVQRLVADISDSKDSVVHVADELAGAGVSVSRFTSYSLSLTHFIALY